MLKFIDSPLFHWEEGKGLKTKSSGQGGNGAIFKYETSDQKAETNNYVVKKMLFKEENEDTKHRILREGITQKFLQNQMTCKIKSFVYFTSDKNPLTKTQMFNIGIKIENLEEEVKKKWKNGTYPLFRCFESIHSHRGVGYIDLSLNNWVGKLIDFGSVRKNQEDTLAYATEEAFGVTNTVIIEKIDKVGKQQHFDRYSIALMAHYNSYGDHNKINNLRGTSGITYPYTGKNTSKGNKLSEVDALANRNTTVVPNHWLSLRHMSAVYEAGIIECSTLGPDSDLLPTYFAKKEDGSTQYGLEDIQEYNGKDDDDYGISRGILRGAHLGWYPQTLFERVRMNGNAAMGLGELLLDGYESRGSRDGLYVADKEYKLKPERVAAFTLFRHAARLQGVDGASRVRHAMRRVRDWDTKLKGDFEGLVRAGEEMEGILRFDLAEALYTAAANVNEIKGNTPNKNEDVSLAKERLGLLQLKRMLLSSSSENPNEEEEQIEEEEEEQIEEEQIEECVKNSFHGELYRKYVLNKNKEKLEKTKEMFPSMFVGNKLPKKEDWLHSVFCLYTPVFCRDLIFLYEGVELSTIPVPVEDTSTQSTLPQ